MAHFLKKKKKNKWNGFGMRLFNRCLKCDWSEGKVLGKKSFWEIQKSTFLNMLKVAEAELKAKFVFYLGQIRIIWT